MPKAPPLPKQTSDRTREAEEGLVGSLLVDPSWIPQVRAMLQPDDFLINALADAYQAILSAYAISGTADPLLVQTEAAKLGVLVDAQDLIRWITGDQFALNALRYAELIKDGAVRRHVLGCASGLAAAAIDPSSNIPAEAAKAARALLHASTSESGKDPVAAVEARVDEWRKNPLAPGQVRGVPTGMPAIDRLLGGLEPSLVVVGAGTHVGKTAWACQVARNAASHGFRTMYATKEMLAGQLITRLACSVSKVDLYRLKSGRIDDGEFEVVRQALGILRELPLWWDDSSRTIDELIGKAHALRATKKLDLLIVDSLGLFVPRTTDQRPIQIGQATEALLGAAADLEVPVVVLHHLGRSVQQRSRPQMEDLQWSSFIEQDADIVAFLWRAELNASLADGTPNRKGRTMEFIVRKNRLTGRFGTAMLYFGEFTEIERYAEETDGGLL